MSLLQLKAARDFAKLQITSKYGDDAKFRLSSESGPAHHHVAFEFAGHLFFIALDLKELAFEQAVSLHDMVALSDLADASPLTMTLTPQRGEWSLAERNSLFRCARTGIPVDPSIIALDVRWTVRPNLLTPYDLQEHAINVVSGSIIRTGGVIESRYVGFGLQPSITFLADGQRKYVFVVHAPPSDQRPTFPARISTAIEHLGLPVEQCSWGWVSFVSRNRSASPDKEANGVQLSRRDALASRFDGLQAIPASLKVPRSSYTTTSGDVLVNYAPAGAPDHLEYRGFIDFDDLNPFAQDRLIKQAIESSARKSPTRHHAARDFGIVSDQFEGVHNLFSNAISFLQYNGFVADDSDRNFYHQLRRLFANSTLGVRLDELLYDLHQYPFSRRTTVPSATWRLSSDIDAEALNVEKSPKLFAKLIGLDINDRPLFPYGGDRKLEADMPGASHWKSRSLIDALDWLRHVLQIRDFAIVDNLAPWLSDKALAKAKKQFASPVDYLASLLVSRSAVLVSKAKRCEENWPGAFETSTGFANLPKPFVAHDLHETGYRLIDFLFDCIGHLQKCEALSNERAIQARVTILQSAFGYDKARLYCA